MDPQFVKCPKCLTDNPSVHNYCLACGSLLKENLVNTENKCPFCQFEVKAQDVFCPHCGKKIRETPLSSSIGKQIMIYLLSFLLPPLGLWPAFKYLRQKDTKLKFIGIIAVALTFVSIIISAVLIVNVMNDINRQVNEQINNLMQY